MKRAPEDENRLIIDPVSFKILKVGERFCLPAGISTPEVIGQNVTTLLSLIARQHGRGDSALLELSYEDHEGRVCLVANSQSRREQKWCRALHDVSCSMEATGGDADSAFALLAEKSVSVMPAPAMAVWLREEAVPSVIEARGCCGAIAPAKGARLDVNLFQGLLRVFSSGEACTTPELDRLAAAVPGARACLTVPILFNARIAGVLTFFDSEPRNWTPDEIEFAGMMARQATTILTYADWRHVQGNVRESEERYRQFVQNSSEAIWRVEFPEPIPLDLPLEEQLRRLPQGVIAECNEAGARLTGHHRAAELIGTPFATAMSMEDSRTFIGLRNLVELGYTFHNVEVWHGSKDGSQYWLLQNIEPVIENGKLLRLWCAARDVSEQRERARQIRALASRQQEIVEAERARISREIHDDLGQQLCALRMMVASAVSKEIDSGVSITLGQALPLIDGAIQSSKRISTDLRPPILDHLGLAAAVEANVHQFRKTTGIACDLDVQEDIEVPKDQALTIFRILQECLSNAARHSGADAVMVTLIAEEDEIVLRISDNGKGMPGSLSSGNRELGLGLLNMKERASACGGMLTIESQPGRGTAVEARFPVQRTRRLATA